MLNRMIFLNHVIVMNDPGKETISAGLGPAEQYIIILMAILLVGF